MAVVSVSGIYCGCALPPDLLDADRVFPNLHKGERRSKDDVVFEALGSVDEANARIGLAREMVEDPELKRCFGTVQHVLFDAGAAVATPRTLSTERRLAAVSFDKTLVGVAGLQFSPFTRPLHIFPSLLTVSCCILEQYIQVPCQSWINNSVEVMSQRAGSPEVVSSL